MSEFNTKVNRWKILSPTALPCRTLRLRQTKRPINLRPQSRRTKQKIVRETTSETKQHKKTQGVIHAKPRATNQNNIYAINHKTRGKTQPQNLAYQQRSRSGSKFSKFDSRNKCTLVMKCSSQASLSSKRINLTYIGQTKDINDCRNPKTSMQFITKKKHTSY